MPESEEIKDEEDELKEILMMSNQMQSYLNFSDNGN